MDAKSRPSAILSQKTRWQPASKIDPILAPHCSRYNHGPALTNSYIICVNLSKVNQIKSDGRILCVTLL